MSPKRALLLLASAIATGVVGGTLTLGTTAAGSPAASAPAAVTPGEPATHLPLRVGSTQPKTTLSLPTTLHLVNQNTTTISPGGSSHLVITAALTHKGGGAAGSAVYTCVKTGSSEYACDSAFALPSGILYTHENIVVGSQFKGTVTGGSGKYEGATGTIKAAPRSSGKQSLTISYSLG